MKCSKARPNLLDHCRGLLSPAETQAMCEHLESCAECKALLEEEARLARGLSALPLVAPASDVWPVVESRVRGERRPIWAFAMALGFGFRRAVAVAAVALVLMVALFVRAPWSPSPSERDSIRQAASLMQVQPASQPSDDQLTRTSDDMMKVIDSEL